MSIYPSIMSVPSAKKGCLLRGGSVHGWKLRRRTVQRDTATLFLSEFQESKPNKYLYVVLVLHLVAVFRVPLFHAFIMPLARSLREVGVLTPRRVGTWMEAP
jgi:hypothetical protein